MKKFFALLAPLLVLFLPLTSSKAADAVMNVPVATQLQDAAVTVVADDASGSGVIVTRKDAKGKPVVLVWTAGHVVAHLRVERELTLPDGTHKTQVLFKNPIVKRRIVEGGREVGWGISDATVIRYSNPNTGEDLALLLVNKKDFSTATTSFYLDDSIPEIGTPLLHVGSFLGEQGADSMSEGNYSQVGRLFAETVFDQTSVVAYPGSSGGGVYLRDGRYVGMLVRAAGPSFNFIVPIRRIRSWASSAQVLWALDPTAPFPSKEELSARKLSVETPGTYLPVDGDASSSTAHFLIEPLD